MEQGFPLASPQNLNALTLACIGEILLIDKNFVSCALKKAFFQVYG
jgi:hypothetical protein